MARLLKRWAWLIPATLFVALLGLKVFSVPQEFGLVHFFLIALLPGILLIRIIGFIYKDELTRTDQLELGALLIIASRVAIQTSGGMDSAIYPLNYLIFAFVVSIVQPREAVVLFMFLAGLEALILTTGRAWSGGLVVFLAHAGLAAGFGVLIGTFVRIERRGRRRAEDVLRHLKQDASQLRISQEEFRELPALSSSDRNREAVRGVFRLDDAFLSVLQLLKQTLRAYTAALYWADVGQTNDGVRSYRLREVISDAEGINSDPVLRAGEGLLGLTIQGNKLVNLSYHPNPGANIPYYHHAPGIRSLAAAPVKEGDSCLGLLVIDSLKERAFGPDDEKVLACFADQVKEVHDHALLFQKTLIEASKFKGLTELSHMLNTTLEIGEILDIVLRATAPILGYDLAAISLWDEDGLEQVVKAASGRDAGRLKEVAFPLEGSLAGWVVAQKKYLSIARLRDRERKTPIFVKRPKLGFAQSLLAYPLNLYDETLGSIVFLSERQGAFSAYDVQVTGLIADLAASATANARLYQEMEKQAVSDGLTGLYNHRYFQEGLKDEIERAERHPGPFSVILIDLDYFKSINDTYGHPVGDKVLKAIAKLIRDSIRRIDLAARYGGEEFVIMLVNTDAEGSLRLAERIRKAASRMVFNAGKEEFSITLSAGVAAFPVHGRQSRDLVEAADTALYRAKTGGRNRTVVFRPKAKLKKAAVK